MKHSGSVTLFTAYKSSYICISGPLILHFSSGLVHFSLCFVRKHRTGNIWKLLRSCFPDQKTIMSLPSALALLITQFLPRLERVQC